MSKPIKYPEYVFAMVSGFLGECREGDLLRKFTGSVSFRHEKNSSTYKNGLLHSYNDQPATITITHFQTIEKWYKDGKLHRENDLPAIKSSIGNQQWYKNGVLHRDGDKPASISTICGIRKVYYKNGMVHRDDDKPAVVEHCNNTRDMEWWKNGIRHRDNDKPVIITESGEFWYVNGEFTKSA